MAPLPVITYGPTRGRAEPIRLILEELAIEYRENHITSWAEWIAVKPQMPFLQIPTYQDGDSYIVQSHAIYRHLARIHNLYGKTEAERIECDIVEEAIHDAQHDLWWFLNGLLPEKNRQKFAAGQLTITLSCLERHFGRRSPARFWVGDAVSFVDFLSFAYLDDVRALFPEVLSKFVRLFEFRNEIAARPRIADYLHSNRRPAAILFGPHGNPVVDPQSSAPVPKPFWSSQSTKS